MITRCSAIAERPRCRVHYCEVARLAPASSEVARVVFGSWVTAVSELGVRVATCSITASAGSSLIGRAPAALFPGSPLVLGPAPELARPGCSVSVSSCSTSLLASISGGGRMGALGSGRPHSPRLPRPAWSI